ncbi:CAP domain-containing protein [Priestia megaterium]|uniref:CAP domain-containing protein n=1 Tax=Priestia megaterium TaxID=1404 RepID=UPI002FE28D04
MEKENRRYQIDQETNNPNFNFYNQVPENCKNQSFLQFLPGRDSTLDSLPLEQAVTEYINRLRSNMGIPKKLINDSQLNRIANLKAKDMADNKHFEHNSPTYGRAVQMAKDQGFWTNCVSENIAYGPTNAYDVFTLWFCSPPHFSTMTNAKFDTIGVGFAKGQDYEELYRNNKWSAMFSSTEDHGHFNCI